jgi:transcription-repair coupling factor (superfamily II helicase)
VSSSLQSLVERLTRGKSGPVRVVRSGPGTMARLACALLAQGRSVAACAVNRAALAELRALVGLFSPDVSATDPSPLRTTRQQRVVVMPPPYPVRTGGADNRPERMAALYSLKQKRDGRGILTTPDAFLLRLPPEDIFDVHELILSKGMEMAPELVLDQALEWGYSRVPMVNAPGEIAVRGDILDIFCPGCYRPLRLEFFGDTLDDLRHFEPVSQRSIADVQEMVMIPASPVILSRRLRAEAEAFRKREVNAGRLDPAEAAALVRMLDENSAALFPGMFYDTCSRLEDWLPEDTVYLLPGAADVRAVLEESERRLQALREPGGPWHGLSGSVARALRPSSEAAAFFAAARCACFEDLRIGIPDTPEEVAMRERNFSSYQELFTHGDARERPWQHLLAVMRDWAGAGRRDGKQAAKSDRGRKTGSKGGGPARVPRVEENVEAQDDADGARDALLARPGGRLLLSFSTGRARTRFLKLAAQDGISPHLRLDTADYGIFALISPFRKGIHLAWDHCTILGEDVLQPRADRARQPSAAAAVFQGLESHDTLSDGDFLVHKDYGLGIFRGLHRMAPGGTESDYLLLQYAGDDKLYLPVDRLSLIQPFKSAEGVRPVPDRLGGAQWATGKEKARKAVMQIASDLVEMYALRKVLKGFRYGPPDEMYREFEAGFGFEETPDQAKAIEDVLNDMEKGEPMDRLVCGDVGFGKTEVAMRAAVRAALEGRQTALLCPTTVLAEQHYRTFRSRLAALPVNVGLLSRFVSAAKQRDVLKATAEGRIDVLIGTHRILSNDVVIPNLGLLILDEEQRFGVRHKERLKGIRKNVDALTLTATPIPRTLQLSLSGIRELSVIETPPPERKPVSTALIARDDELLRGILRRELDRQGQIFWVYNRVDGLERVADYVRTLAPDARLGIAHGRMSESSLEKNMRKFWLGDLDILVCTSIIESGLDFPRANTLVVDQAHLFGLGQLYQLRGRVGRSDRQAFAVFVTPDPERLQENTRKRLRIILEMDYLGAGFKTAMEDLRLRGAGNILGESQSGHINRVGLEMFMEMLEQAVAELKGVPAQSFTETELSLGIPAFIPENYMPDGQERLRCYKRLSSAQDEAALKEAAAEIGDRFGRRPPELENFIAVLAFKRRLGRHFVSKADIFPDKVRLSFVANAGPDPVVLVGFITAAQHKGLHVRLQPPGILELPFGGGNGPDANVPEALDKLWGFLYPLWHEAET